MDAEFLRELTELIDRYQPEEDLRSDKEREMEKEWEQITKRFENMEVKKNG